MMTLKEDNRIKNNSKTVKQEHAFRSHRVFGKSGNHKENASTLGVTQHDQGQ
jgi:ribosomal protein L35